MTGERWIDQVPGRRKPSQRDGVADALLRAKRSAGGSSNLGPLPRNRSEARRYMKGAGPYMRFRYEVDDDGVRRAVRV